MLVTAAKICWCLHLNSSGKDGNNHGGSGQLMGGSQRNGGPENQCDCSPSGVHSLVSVSAGLSFPETNRHWF